MARDSSSEIMGFFDMNRELKAKGGGCIKLVLSEYVCTVWQNLA